MKQKVTQNLINGLERIEEIKTEIQNSTKDASYCKAEVIDMWNGVFEEEDEEG